MLNRIWRSKAVQETLGSGLASYLRFVGRTSTYVAPESDPYAVLAECEPVILAFWHGQHFMIPLAKRPQDRFNVLISRHGDGELNAIAVKKLGIGLVRGSGAQRSDQVRKRGGVRALLDMIGVLERGETMALTADVPKVSRVAGRGIITLAQKSGRPILPVAVVCSRRIDFSNWDRSSLGLPFGRWTIEVGQPIAVTPRAGPEALEAARQALEEDLDRIHDLAYRRLGRRDPGAARPEVAAARTEARRLPADR